MYHMTGWDHVGRRPQLHWRVVRHCTTNPSENRPPFFHLLKPSEIRASCHLLIRPLLKLKCDQRH
eukprot:9388373-Pyramimonas_sp.AAC.1